MLRSVGAHRCHIADLTLRIRRILRIPIVIFTSSLALLQNIKAGTVMRAIYDVRVQLVGELLDLAVELIDPLVQGVDGVNRTLQRDAERCNYASKS